MNIRIEKYDHEGRGIGLYNKKIVFIPNTIIGEVVDAHIIEEKKNYAIGKVQEYLTKSSKRIEPKCPYYNECGGCNYQHLSFLEELKIKQDTLKNILLRYANINKDIKLIRSSNEYNYRNKITLKIQNGEFGYYTRETHKFVKINKCLLAKDSINNIILNKDDYFKIKNGEIIIRSNYNDEIIINIKSDDKVIVNVDKLIVDNKISGIILNNKHIYGEEFYIEKVNEYIFKVNINSFFQVNLDILSKLFKLLSTSKYHNVIDLYCGVGTLGIALKKDKLFGIEVIEEAIKDATTNGKMNKQNNEYFLSDSAKISEINEKIDAIIIDPPRSGLNKETMINLLKFKSKTIIYMSCNPITLARDLSVLTNDYRVDEIYMLDMFPRTKHVECVSVLSRKDK